jgi:membrane glycosyltransferase
MNAEHQQMVAPRQTMVARAYVGGIFLLAMLLTALMASMLVWGSSNWPLAALWICGFFLVVLNLCYLMVACACALFAKPRILPEANLDRMPPTAILYVVKNEGPELGSKMIETLQGNVQSGVDCWLVSSSDKEGCVLREENFVRELRCRFGLERVHLYRPFDGQEPGRKHVAIQRWSKEHSQYKYFIVCDADSVLYPDTVRKLASKAEHPENGGILLFQSHLNVARSPTRFGSYLEPGQNIVNSMLCGTNYRLLGCSPYYGHGALIRRAPFSQIFVPAHVLSHDMWDTAAIDAAGWKLAFCHDTKILELLPANYLEFRRRSKRWILGTLEALPLLFRRDVSLGARFFLGFAVYSYLIQPVFLTWVLLGLLLNNALSGPQLTTQSLMLGGNAAVDIEMGGVGLALVGFMWAYKLLFCRSFREAVFLIRDVAAGTMILMNNMLYESCYLVATLWSTKVWVPMDKGEARALTFKESFMAMWPSTLCGLLFAVLGAWLAPKWAWLSSPILASFILGSLTVYWTSKPIRAATCSAVAVGVNRLAQKEVS